MVFTRNQATDHMTLLIFSKKNISPHPFIYIPWKLDTCIQYMDTCIFLCDYALCTMHIHGVVMMLGKGYLKILKSFRLWNKFYICSYTLYLSFQGVKRMHFMC